MNILAIVAVCFFAGMGAGLGTGFAGMSAAAVITPMLVTFLKMEPYEAVGIALVSHHLQLARLIAHVVPAQAIAVEACLYLRQEQKPGY